MTGREKPPEPLVHVTRGGVVESVHAGHLVVLDPDGAVVVSVGDADAVLYARSALKPLQLAGLLEAGLWPGSAATDDDARRRALALGAASHSGEAVHLDGVRAVLAAAGLDEGALRNTPDQPLEPREAALRVAAGVAPSSLAQNCSGKHAAMLAACAAAGWPVEGYLDPDHPAQAAALAGVAARAPLVGGPGDRSVDGCGTVLPLVVLSDLARAYGRLASADGADDGADARVAAGMRAHPHLVGGARRESTAAMTAGTGAGVVAKDGAEGVFALALADGRAAAWKTADGAVRAHAPLVGAVLAHLGVGDEPGEDDDRDAGGAAVLGDRPVLGHGRPVGAATVAPDVLDALRAPSPR